MERIEIDGSIGGGSVLRVALPLAISLKKEIVITNIRKNRPKPGLRNQHLLGVNALAKLANYSIQGNKIGSNEIELIPNPQGSKVDRLTITIETAASVSLIFQAISNYCIASKEKVTIDFIGGGTHTEWSPSFDYLRYCFVPILHSMGIECSIYTDRIGFYPKGGAKGNFTINATEKNNAFDFSQPSSFDKIQMYGTASEKLKPAKVVERMLSAIELPKHQLDVKIQYSHTLDPGVSLTGVVCYANGLKYGISLLGKKGLKSENIGKMMTDQITKHRSFRDYCVDEYMADQLLLPLAFAPGGSRYAFLVKTDHVIVNMKIIEKIFGQVFEIEEINDVFVIKRI